MPAVKEKSYIQIQESTEESPSSRKRLFIGLITGTSFCVCLLLFFLWLVPYVGLANIHPWAPWILGLIILTLMILIAWSSLALVLNILFSRPILFSKRMRGITIKLFLPLMTLLGRSIGLSKQKIRSSFIKVNNEMVQSEGYNYLPEEILLLLPHCLQNSQCKYRLTYDINNCKRCGKCPIADLLNLSEHYGVHLAIATGGTIARRIVVQTKPKLIIAVACERDLSSGIQDTYPLPVFGVLNNRPYGPCLDTNVAIKDMEQALRYFLHPSQCPSKMQDA